jgi:hypothetical protein
MRQLNLAALADDVEQAKRTGNSTTKPRGLPTKRQKVTESPTVPAPRRTTRSSGIASEDVVYSAGVDVEERGRITLAAQPWAAAPVRHQEELIVVPEPIRMSHLSDNLGPGTARWVHGPSQTYT